MTNYEKWKFYTKDIESPDIFIKWGFIHLIASALQRRVWLWPDPVTTLPCSFSLFANPFILLVGPPSVGKGRVIKQEASILRHPKLDRVEQDGRTTPLIKTSPDKVTCEKLIRAIHDSQKVGEYYITDKDGKQLKRAFAHNSCSFLIEELEVLFARQSHDMVSVLNQCFDCGNLDYETAHQGEFHIRNICVSMIAGTTEESIRSLMTEKLIKTGFTSRIIVIWANEPRFFRLFPGIDLEQQKAYYELLEYVKRLSTVVCGPVVLAPDAEAYYKEKYESGDMHKDKVNKDPKLKDYYGRKNIHWLKVAMVQHYSENSNDNIITLEELISAYESLGEAEVRMHMAYYKSGENRLYNVGREILSFVEERKQSKFKTLWFYFAEQLQKQELLDCLEYLVGTGQLKSVNGINNIEHGVFEKVT